MRAPHGHQTPPESESMNRLWSRGDKSRRPCQGTRFSLTSGRHLQAAGLLGPLSRSSAPAATCCIDSLKTTQWLVRLLRHQPPPEREGFAVPRRARSLACDVCHVAVPCRNKRHTRPDATPSVARMASTSERAATLCSPGRAKKVLPELAFSCCTAHPETRLLQCCAHTNHNL